LEVQFIFPVTKFNDRDCKKLFKSYCENCSFKLGLCKSVRFLGAFAKLPKVTIIFVVFVYLFIHCMEELGSCWMDLHEIEYLNIFENM